MSKTLAVFGAGTGLGAATARRFGREGYAVALVARRPERLDALVAELGDDGIEAAAFPADLSEPAAVPALVERIVDRFDRIDVVEYAPIPAAAPMLPATEVTADLLGRLAGLYLHTPVETARAVLPAMIERGDGAFLLGQGVSAVRPLPGMSGVGPVMAAARNWILSLHGELAAHGVYAGTLSVAAWVEGSAGHRAASDADPGLGNHPTVTAAELADQYWDLYTRRDRPERVHPPLPTA
ncbi:SDR family NAD(P)-dependent oxidoreductase [Streptomyces sp. NPDC087226]|jgi:NADP-dependent 3-hydroxy acid dehydrogenase YdfG|uniref:SDR family NAD(P)-dependent oxidoreductase n=1 Tax=Streptomyces sp. NPDC087226 TaxID=3365771 RepID=UPI00382EDF17